MAPSDPLGRCFLSEPFLEANSNVSLFTMTTSNGGLVKQSNSYNKGKKHNRVRYLVTIAVIFIAECPMLGRLTVIRSSNPAGASVSYKQNIVKAMTHSLRSASMGTSKSCLESGRINHC